MKSKNMHSDTVALATIVCFGLLIRLLAVTVLSIAPESDYAAYQAMAMNLLAGNGIIDSLGNLAMYNVGYPLFILAPAFAISGNSLLAAQLANAILGAISIALCYAVAREAGGGRIARLLAALLFALYLPSLLYAEYLAKENLMIPLMLAAIWYALRLARTGSLVSAAFCGGMFGLLALTGNAALATGGAVLGAILLAPCQLHRKALATAALAMVALCIATPWMIRNYHVLGAPVLNTNGGFNLYLGNNPAATGEFVSISDTPLGPRWKEMQRHGEVEASELLRQAALGWIKEHPAEFTALAVKKALLFWKPPVHEGKGAASHKENLIRLLWLFQFVVLVFAAVASLAFSQLRTPPVILLWLAVAGYATAHMLFYIIFRYREPIMPFICVLAAMTLERAWLKWRLDATPASALAKKN